MKKNQMYPALLLLAVAGAAIAAPVVDGLKGASDGYGPAQWLNNVPTGFGDNVQGAGAGAGDVGTPATVVRGIELVVPKASVGYTSGPIRVIAAINGQGNDFFSNQFLFSRGSNSSAGGLGLNTPNLGFPRDVNLADIPGVVVSNITPATVTTAPVIDGQSDNPTAPLTIYGNRFALQTNYTGFGKASHGNIIAGPDGTNGSELDALYVVQDATNLYFFLAGNLEANNNKLNLFIDTVAGQGQNRLVQANPQELATMSDDGSGNGLRFPTNFDADYLLVLGANRNGETQPVVFPTPGPDRGQIYVDFYPLPAGGGSKLYAGVTGFAGALDPSALDPLAPAGTLAGGDAGAPAIRVTVDNSNIAGVVGQEVGSTNAAPNQNRAYGSELNALYAARDGDMLYLLVTGNLETNFNKLVLFFDVDPNDGQNRLRGRTDSALWPGYRGNPRMDSDGLWRMGARVQSGTTPPLPIDPTDPVASGGWTFDEGFTADYVVAVTNGGNPVSAFTNAAVLRASGRREDFQFRSLDYGAFTGGAKSLPPVNNPMRFNGPAAPLPPTADGHITANHPPRGLADLLQLDLNTELYFFSSPPASLNDRIVVAIDNSNVLGVTGTAADPNDARAVNSGIEIAISLTELGWDGVTPIRVAGGINGSNYDFMSNQVLGGLPVGTNGQAANLADPRNINFSTIAGDQFVTLNLTTIAGCSPADIANTDGDPTPDNTVDNGDFGLFFASFFLAEGDPNRLVADIANTDGDPGADGTVDNGDFTLFFATFFVGCP
ncbi:MAG: GC-type dockerin domain-anchored protein [Phycisphaerales bacterium]